MLSDVMTDNVCRVYSVSRKKKKNEKRNCSWPVCLWTFLCNVTFQTFKDLKTDSRRLLFSLFSPFYVWDADVFCFVFSIFL